MFLYQAKHKAHSGYGVLNPDNLWLRVKRLQLN